MSDSDRKYHKKCVDSVLSVFLECAADDLCCDDVLSFYI